MASIATLEELHRIIDLVPDPVAVVRDGVLAWANPALHELLGQPPGALAGQEAESVVVPEERPGLPQGRSAGRSGVHGPGVEAHWLRRDGSVVAVEQRTLAIELDGAGAWLVVARDLTSIRALAARAEQLDQLIAVGTLAAGVGHEINNPMAYVISNLAQLADGLSALQASVTRGEVPEDLGPRLSELLEAVGDAREGADRVRRIVLGLRTLSSTPGSARTRVQLEAVLDAAVAMSWGELRHRVQVVRDYHPLPPVLADEERLRQALGALVGNAAHAMAGDGELRLRIFLEGTEAVVEVEDTGIGMAPEVLRRAFEPFFTTRKVGAGMGLGLYTALATVQAHGGRLTAISELGLGTTFRVALPVVLPEEARPARKRLLLVDDEAPVRSSLSRALAPHHDVVFAANGEEALALLTPAEHFDAIVCDITMPCMSGLQLLRQIKLRRPDLSAKVVLMTGGTTTEQLQELLEREAAPLLEKPFEMRQLLATVQRLAGDSRQDGPGPR